MSFDPLSSHGLCGAIEQAVDVGELFGGSWASGAAEEFETRRANLFREYTAERTSFYRSVRRFSTRPFWRERVIKGESHAI